MIEDELIEKAEKMEEELEEKDIKEKYKPVIMRAFLEKRLSPNIKEVASNKEVKIKENQEEIEVELEGSILDNEEIKDAISRLCSEEGLRKNAVISTLTLLDREDRATLKEISDFAEYKDTSNISSTCTSLEKIGILQKEEGEEGKIVSLKERWAQKLLKRTNLRERKEKLIDRVKEND